MSYSIVWKISAQERFLAMEKTIRIRISRKIAKLSEVQKSSRHLRSNLPFFVEEVGQYRICFEIDETTQSKIIYFVGDHKEYEGWYKSYR